MGVLNGVSDFFGLDIGSNAIRVVQLRSSGKYKSLVRYAYAPVDTKLAMSDAKADQKNLSEAVANVVRNARLTTNNVAVGIPSQKVFTTVFDIDNLPMEELAKAIRYQADSLIPTPIDESKVDWAVLGQSPKDPKKVEILLSSVTNAYIESRLDVLEAIGLNVIAFEPDGIALARAVTAPDNNAPQMAIDIGTLSTDLVITVNGAPRLTRSIPTGTDAIVKSAMQGLNVDAKQAQQFVFKFGISKDKLEGQVYNAIIGTVDILVSEIEKSIKFFQSRYPNIAVQRVIVTGGASTLPELPLYIANKFNISVEIGNAWRNISFSADRQNELAAVSNYFAVAAGLAERKE